MSNDWLQGAAMNVSGSVLINWGVNVMKLGHIRILKRKARRAALERSGQGLRQRHNPSKSISCCLDSWAWTPSTCQCFCYRERFAKTWVIGFTAFICGNALNFLSFSFAAQSLLASLGSVQFITNVLFARIVLKERLSTRTLIGTAVLIGGVAIVVTFSCHGNPAVDYSLDELIALFVDPQYVIFLVCLLVLWLASQIALWRIGEAKNAGGKTRSKLEGVSFAAASAVIGSQAVTLFKILSELITILSSVAKTDDNVTAHAIYKSPFSYLVVFGAVFTSVYWVRRLNLALKLYDTLFIVPVFQVFWITFSSIGGGIFFHEFNKCFEGKTAVLYVLGLLTIFAGVFLLSPQNYQEVASSPVLPIRQPLLSTSSSLDDGQHGDQQQQDERRRSTSSHRDGFSDEDLNNLLMLSSGGGLTIPTFQDGLHGTGNTLTAFSSGGGGGGLVLDLEDNASSSSTAQDDAAAAGTATTTVGSTTPDMSSTNNGQDDDRLEEGTMEQANKEISRTLSALNLGFAIVPVLDSLETNRHSATSWVAAAADDDETGDDED